MDGIAQPRKSPPLILHTESSDGWGGQEIRILQELRGMRRFGFSTALIAPAHSEIYRRARAEGFNTHAVRFGTKAHLPSWRRIFKIIARLRPQVVNTHSSDDGWMAGVVARILRVPLIIRTRHVSTPIGSTFSYRYLADRILTTSGIIRKDLMDQGLDGGRIESVPTGIDAKRFAFLQGHRRRIRALFGISDSEVLVGNVCVLRSWKGLDFFIETASSSAPGFRFILVGDGPQRRQLEEKAERLGLTNRLFFTGHQETVEHYFSALDVFFFTSYASEGVPQSLLQAMSVGLPILACGTPSVRETLQGYPDVVFVNYGEREEARQAMEEIARRHHPNNVHASERRRLLRQEYCIERMWDRLLALYHKWGVPDPVPSAQPSHGRSYHHHGRPDKFVFERGVEEAGNQEHGRAS